MSDKDNSEDEEKKLKKAIKSAQQNIIYNSIDKQVERARERTTKILSNVSLDNSTEWMMERLRLIGACLMDGMSTPQIYDKYNKEWNIARSTFSQDYMPKARELLKSEILKDDNDIRYDLLAKYNHLYGLSMLRGDYKEARTVLDSISKLTQTLTANLTVIGDIQTIRLIEVKKPGDEDIEDVETDEQE